MLINVSNTNLLRNFDLLPSPNTHLKNHRFSRYHFAMQAFLPISPVSALSTRIAIPSLSKRSHQAHAPSRIHVSSRRMTIKSDTSSPDSETLPRFRRDDDDSTKPQSSFFPQPPPQTGMQSPNDRVLGQVRDTMDRLGVSATPPDTSPTITRDYIDISKANPLSAFVGAAGAAFISFVAWQFLNGTIEFSLSHPVNDQIYVVQRVAGVVRTTLVCIFALGSGISGVTGLGLALLGFRTSYGVITGEFSKKE